MSAAWSPPLEDAPPWAPPLGEPKARPSFEFAPRLATGASCVADGAPYVMKGLIERGAVGATYGPRGSGKTFIALKVLRDVATGERVFGLRTARGAVLYLALEGSPLAIERRFAALAPPSDAAPIYWARVPAACDDADFRRTVADFVARENISLVVLDTLTALVGERDENTNAGMNYALRVGQSLVAGSSAALMFVAHTGKDQDRGVRGHSAFEAAADFLIRVEREGDTRSLTLEKVRDGRDGLRFAFDLQTVSLGTDGDGDAIETLVAKNIRPVDAPSRRKPLTGHARTALDALTEASIECGGPLPPSLGLPRGLRGVPFTKWRERFESKLGDDEPEAKRKAFQRARVRLLDEQLVGVEGAFAWLTNQKVRDDGTRDIPYRGMSLSVPSESEGHVLDMSPDVPLQLTIQRRVT